MIPYSTLIVSVVSVALVAFVGGMAFANWALRLRIAIAEDRAKEALQARVVTMWSLDDYQEAASRTDNLDLTEVEAQKCYAMGLAGEAGEVADYLKKVFWHGHKMERSKLVKELGDVLWYVAMVAFKFRITLSEVAKENVIKLRLRYGQRFSSEASVNRLSSE